MSTVYRSCNLCEASCGLALEVESDRVVSARGDGEDAFSRGYVCPKGVAFAELHHDSDRLRRPLRRQSDGGFAAIGWDEALAVVAERLSGIRARHCADAIAVYLGNPIVHNHGALMLRSGLLAAIGSRNCYSAGSQDTSPRFATSYHLYGSSLVVPVPDIDRCGMLLCVGANPWVSNGSFMTAPDVRRRLRALRARGGRLIVVDPRRSETAQQADEWVPIRPGSDAALLLGLAQALVEAGRVDDDARVGAIATGWPELRPRLARFAPERVAGFTGIAAATIRRLAQEFADASSGCAYSRVGVCNGRFGTLGCWAIDVLNLVAGRLGAVGGAMFTTPAVDLAPLVAALGDGHGRWRSRVRGLPETLGDLPAAALAEEIETPGPGQVRALLTYAGNPRLSLPNGRRVERALATLDFHVAIDCYVNETNRHADVILPPAGALAEDHVDLFTAHFAVRNVARWSPPAVAPGPDERADWEILLAVAERLGGGATGVRSIDGAIRLARRFGMAWTPTTSTMLLARLGAHGDRFRPWSRGFNPKRLAAAAHGIDLGPLEPGIARRVRHKDGRVRIAPEAIMAGLPALERALDEVRPSDELLLVGRRDARSNNSWMHNLATLAGGRERCVLLVHPADAARCGVADGARARLASRVHAGLVTVRVAEDLMPGVVSLPHGWGNASVAAWQRISAQHPGVSANDWTDDAEVEEVVGQSILNGVPVRLGPARDPDLVRSPVPD